MFDVFYVYREKFGEYRKESSSLIRFKAWTHGGAGNKLGLI